MKATSHFRGHMFADLRGFTSDSESRTPAEVSTELRRFYAHAEKFLAKHLGGRFEEE